MKYLLIVLLCLFAKHVSGQDVSMLTDWEASKALATKENKNILIILTGSEWCTPCKKMDKAVIAHPSFQKYAQEHLVIFLVDLPKNIVMNSETYQYFMQFSNKYQTSAMPSLVLTDSNGHKIKLLEGKMFRIENVMAQLEPH